MWQDCAFVESSWQRKLTLGEVHHMADLQFILLWFSCFAYVEWTTVLLVWSNPNQSNRRSAVQWYFPPVVSVLCQLGIVAFWGSTLSSGKQSFTIGNKNDQTDAKDCMWKGLMLLAKDWRPDPLKKICLVKLCFAYFKLGLKLVVALMKTRPLFCANLFHRLVMTLPVSN